MKLNIVFEADKYYYSKFDKRFVKIENENRKSIRVGEWRRDVIRGYDILEIECNDFADNTTLDPKEYCLGVAEKAEPANISWASQRETMAYDRGVRDGKDAAACGAKNYYIEKIEELRAQNKRLMNSRDEILADWKVDRDALIVAERERDIHARRADTAENQWDAAERRLDNQNRSKKVVLRFDQKFGDAFNGARKMGADEFVWKGKRYHTRRADEY